MITNALIILATVVANTVLFIFPSSSGFPSDVSTAVAYIGGFVGMVDPILPVDSILAILTLVITFELAVFGFKAFKWVISHLPFVGGRG